MLNLELYSLLFTTNDDSKVEASSYSSFINDIRINIRNKETRIITLSKMYFPYLDIDLGQFFINAGKLRQSLTDKNKKTETEELKKEIALWLDKIIKRVVKK